MFAVFAKFERELIIERAKDEILKIEAEVQKRLYKPNKTTHINLTDTPSTYSIVKEKVYNRYFSTEEKIIRLKEVDVEEVYNSNNLAI